MVIKCPLCNTTLPRGKTINFTDLARVIVKHHTCKNPSCNASIFTNADTCEILKVNGKNYQKE